MERRHFQGTELRVTTGENGNPIISGYAIVYGKASENLGGFVEYVADNAFVGHELDDIRLLVNHDNNKVLARTKSGTLKVRNDAGVGAWFEAELDPKNPDVQAIVSAMGRGDIDQCSFQFIVSEQLWNEGVDPVERTILGFAEVLDFSVVTYPAYPDTSANVRELDIVSEEACAIAGALVEQRNGATLTEAQVEILRALTSRTKDETVEDELEVTPEVTPEEVPAEEVAAVEVETPEVEEVAVVDDETEVVVETVDEEERTVEDAEVEERAGRVLSEKNVNALSDAATNIAGAADIIDEVLSSAAPADGSNRESDVAESENRGSSVEVADGNTQAREEVRTAQGTIVPRTANNNALERENEMENQLEFREYLAGATHEVREGLNTVNGAVLVPEYLHSTIAEEKAQVNFVRALVGAGNILSTSSDGVIPFWGAPTAASIVGENVDGTSVEDEPTPVDFTSYKYNHKNYFSDEIRQDSAFPVDTINSKRASVAIGLGELRDFLLGNGTAAPQGIFSKTAEVTAAAAAELTYDDLVDLDESMSDLYSNGAVYVMNQATRGAIRKIKDTTGEPILKDALNAGGLPTLFGKPVYTYNGIDTIAASKKVIALVNFANAYAIVDRKNGRTVKAIETESGVKVINNERTDGRIVDTNAIKVLKMKAS